MADISRRQFLALGTRLAVLMGLHGTAVPRVVEALEELVHDGGPQVLWLQGLSCSGCSVSLMNSENPDAAEILTLYLSLLFHSTLSVATGETALRVINDTIQKGGYYLAVEGSVPAGMPKACMMGDEPVSNQIIRAAQNAKAIVCVGTCAAFGGIPAAENNSTGAMSVGAFLKRENVAKPLINIPGCPSHPDWLVGTLVHLIKFGIPDLDHHLRPKMFYQRVIHDQCPRFADYEREKFAQKFSDDGCLFKLGCLGPVTHADCTVRLWNGQTNTCIHAGAPCIGCAGETFAASTAFPFYPKGPKAMERGGDA